MEADITFLTSIQTPEVGTSNGPATPDELGDQQAEILVLVVTRKK